MSRAGVSLTEVLVAAVLLAVGVGGCLAALSTALRLRTGASARETIAAVAHDRLTWFEGAGCAVGDTLIESPAGTDAQEAWRVEREPGAVHLTGTARGSRAGISFGVALDTRQACE